MDALGSINWWGFSPAIDFWSDLSLKGADKTDIDGHSGKECYTRRRLLTGKLMLYTRLATPVAVCIGTPRAWLANPNPNHNPTNPNHNSEP